MALPMIFALLAFPAQAQLNDQGLNSIISIIDKAITTLSPPTSEDNKAEQNNETPAPENAEADTANSSSTLVNLARTLGTLSFSRLQCGEADVLAEFTKRVQIVPQEYRDLMRTAFQEGFDKSKSNSKLLSEDECKRLTESRQQQTKKPQEAAKTPTKKAEKVEEKKPEPEVDPALKHLRLAHMTGQLAYKRKFCGDAKIHNRDFNEILTKMPKEFQKRAKESYWKGYKQGKRMNKNLTSADCSAYN